MSDSFAESSSPYEPGVTPLQPGEDPLEALSPEMRELVLSTEHATAAADDGEITTGDRIKGTLMGAALGGGAGFLISNFTPRRHRIVGAAPMNLAVTGTFMAIGATIGGVSGFLRGGSPLDTNEQRALDQALRGAHTISDGGSYPARVASALDATAAAQAAPVETHPAFASLHG